MDEYTALMDRLRRRPSSIDDLTDTVAWMAQLPAFVANLEHLVKIKLFEFDILDGFWHALDDAEAMVKWTAVLFPYRIRMQIEPTEAMFEAATEQFAKQQTADLMAFEEQTEQLNQGVFHFGSLADTAKAREYAIDAARLWNSISDADKQGGVLNRRQMLFGRTAMNLSGMRNLRETFAPFRDFWVSAGDLLKLRDTTYGNPLNNVDVGETNEMVERLRQQLLNCANAFAELPSVTNALQYFLDELNEFTAIVEVVDAIKNPDWLMVHWQELGKRAELEIRMSATMNFQYCIDKGILQHCALVKEISRKATEDRYLLEEERRKEEERKREEEEARARLKNRRRGRKLD